MNLKADYQLKGDQVPNPVLQIGSIPLDFDFKPEDLHQVMTGKGHQLKTWGGSESTSAPHWIGVMKQTPMHTDPRYPRYSTQLVCHVDHGFALKGFNGELTHIAKGSVFLLDTHSPHQLVALNKEAKYYLAVSMDWKKLDLIPNLMEVAEILKEFSKHPITENPDRITK